MDEAIKQIGERLKGLREVLNIPAEEVAELCEISLEHYLKIESGEADPSVYRLSKISKRYGIDLDVLLFGEEPRMKGYYVTRNLATLLEGFEPSAFDYAVSPVPPQLECFTFTTPDGRALALWLGGHAQDRRTPVPVDLRVPGPCGSAAA